MSYRLFGDDNSSGYSFFDDEKKKKKDPLADLQSQISNLKFRLDSSGFKAPDKRNWFEKATNLPEGQNWLFDTLDLIQRPFQGVTNMIDGAQTHSGKTAGQEFMEGLTGKEKKYGSDILANAGVKNKYAKAIGGFAADVILDPTTYVGGAIAKGVGKGIGAAGKLGISKLPTGAQEGIQDVGDGFRKIFGSKYHRDLNGNLSTALKDIDSAKRGNEAFWTDEILGTMSQAAKKAGGLNKGVDVAKYIENPIDLVTQKRSQSGEDFLNNIFDNLKPKKAPKSTQKFIDDLNSGKISTTSPSTSQNIEDIINQAKQMPEITGAVKTPEIHDSANIVQDLLKRVRDHGEESGVAIPNNLQDAYLPHNLTDEARRLLGKSNTGGLSSVGGNSKILNARKYDGSVDDINRELNLVDEKGNPVKMFDDNAFTAAATGARKSVEYIEAEKAMKNMLSNPDFARPIARGQTVVPGKNQVVIKTDDYNFLKGMEGDLYKGTKTGKGTEFVVTKDVKNMLDNYKSKLNDEGINKFTQALDAVQNVWKKTALFSAGFHARNAIGNNFNMWVAGMRPDELVKFQSAAAAELPKVKSLLKERQAGKVFAEGSPEAKLLKEYNDFRKSGLKESGVYENEFKYTSPSNAVKNKIEQDNKPLSEKIKEGFNPFSSKNHINKAMEKSRDLGITMDEFNRYSMYKWAREAKNMDPKQAASKVKETLFDYGDLTNAEKQIFKRVAPFYTWLRKNGEFQIKNFAKNPQKYSNFDKGMQEAYKASGVDRNDVADWHKTNWDIPLPFTSDKKGDVKLLSASLPLSDLGKLSNPAKVLTESASPLYKLPIELTTNTNSFNGDKIEEFAGQTKNMGGVQIPAKLQHVLSQIGALRNLGSRSEEIAQDGITGPLQSGFGMLKQHDAAKQKGYDTYEQLQELQDLVKLYEQMYGKKPATVQELADMGILRPQDKEKKSGKYSFFLNR